MVNVVLIITALIFALLIVLASVYFLVYFQHPDDKWSAWFPKVVVVLGLSLACYNIFLLPLDVANQNGLYTVQDGLPMTSITFAFYITTTIWILVVVPFTVFYYEGLDDDDDIESKSYVMINIGL